MNQEFFYKALVDSLPDMVWAFDTNFKLVVANAAFLDMRNSLYGNSLEIGDDIFTHVPEEGVNRWKPIYQRALNGERILQDDTRLIHGSATMRRLSLNPVFNNQNEIIGCMGITYDITYEKSLELNLSEVEDKLNHLNNLTKAQLKEPLANFYNLSNQLLNSKDHSASDQSTMVFLLTEELSKITKKLKDLNNLVNQ
jgi:PAS domain S-box-containing protein